MVGTGNVLGVDAGDPGRSGDFGMQNFTAMPHSSPLMLIRILRHRPQEGAPVDCFFPIAKGYQSLWEAIQGRPEREREDSRGKGPKVRCQDFIPLIILMVRYTLQGRSRDPLLTSGQGTG
jgi:hypothetical protein